MCGKLRYICECDAHAIIRRAKFGVWPLWGVILPEGGLDPSLLDDPTAIFGKLWYIYDLQSIGLLRTKFGE